MFVAEIEQQLIIPVLRSYLKFYTTMPIAKLAAFMEIVSQQRSIKIVMYSYVLCIILGWRGRGLKC